VKLMLIRGTEIKPEPPVTPVGMGKSTRGVELASVDDLDQRQANRYRGLQRFFAWLVEEGVIRVSPTSRMKPPHLPDKPPAVLREEELLRLLDDISKSSRSSGKGSE
jgi:site-specific recombinase XerC